MWCALFNETTISRHFLVSLLVQLGLCLVVSSEFLTLPSRYVPGAPTPSALSSLQLFVSSVFSPPVLPSSLGSILPADLILPLHELITTPSLFEAWLYAFVDLVSVLQ